MLIYVSALLLVCVLIITVGFPVDAAIQKRDILLNSTGQTFCTVTHAYVPSKYVLFPKDLFCIISIQAQQVFFFFFKCSYTFVSHLKHGFCWKCYLCRKLAQKKYE